MRWLGTFGVALALGCGPEPGTGAGGGEGGGEQIVGDDAPLDPGPAHLMGGREAEALYAFAVDFDDAEVRRHTEPLPIDGSAYRWRTLRWSSEYSRVVATVTDGATIRAFAHDRAGGWRELVGNGSPLLELTSTRNRSLAALHYEDGTLEYVDLDDESVHFVDHGEDLAGLYGGPQDAYVIWREVVGRPQFDNFRTDVWLYDRGSGVERRIIENVEPSWMTLFESSIVHQQLDEANDVTWIDLKGRPIEVEGFRPDGELMVDGDNRGQVYAADEIVLLEDRHVDVLDTPVLGPDESRCFGSSDALHVVYGEQRVAWSGSREGSYDAPGGHRVDNLACHLDRADPFVLVYLYNEEGDEPSSIKELMVYLPLDDAEQRTTLWMRSLQSDLDGPNPRPSFTAEGHVWREAEDRLELFDPSTQLWVELDAPNGIELTTWEW